MTCSTCGVFSGPTCGACRAAERILGILRSGRLPASEERRVTLLLRGASGELSDLLESVPATGGGKPLGTSPTKGETSALTPGALAEAGKPVKVQKEDSADSYTEGSEGEEEEATVKDPETGAEAAAPGKDSSKPEQKQEGLGEAPSKEPAEGGLRSPIVTRCGVVLHPAKGSTPADPHYLSKALNLQLKATGKASAHPDRRKRERSEAPRYSSGVDTSKRRHAEKRAPKGDPGASSGCKDERRFEGSARSGRGRSASPDRPPIVRRPRDPREERKRAPKRKKNNKGQKRRDRGRDFKAWQAAQSRSRRRW